MLLSALTAVLLAQGSPTMGGPGVAVVGRASGPSLDYFTSLFVGTITNDCAGTALTMSGGEAVTCTRATDGYCLKTDGTLVNLTSNKCRANTTNGLLVEGGRTNLVIRSQEMDHAAWSSNGFTTVVADNATAPDGTLTAETMTLNAGSTSGGQNYRYSTTWTETVDVVYTRSAYVKAGTVPYVSIYGVTDALQSRYSVFLLSGAGSVLANGAGAVGRIQRLGSTAWYRIETTSTAVSTVTSYFILVWGDTQAHAVPGTTWTAAGTESIVAWGAQTEASTGSIDVGSSYIPTGATATARAADNISFTPSQSYDAAGCASVSVTIPDFTGISGNVLSNSGASVLTIVHHRAAGYYDGTNSATSGLSTDTMIGRTATLLNTWTGIVGTTKADDSTTTTGAFDGTMGTGTTYIGSNGGGSSFVFSYIKNLKLGTTAAGCVL